MQGLPGSRSSGLSSAVHDHHLRMLDMAAYSSQGSNADGGLMMDQYGNSFNAAAAAALYAPQFAAVAGGLSNGPRLNHEHHVQAGFMNGMIKLEALEGGGTGEQSAVTNATSASGEVSGYSSSPGGREAADRGGGEGGSQQSGGMNMAGNALAVKTKAKRRLPGMPDPDAEVMALSPRTLLATNRFVCEICSKGFQRDQNLQLHRRGHNLPWKLKQRGAKEVRKKVYVCPEASCVHHDPARALGDLTGIKKHFSRKHGEKKWKCDKCSKRYAVQSDWKAHSKTCGTREYRCDCGTLFSRRDSFVTHRAFCDALSEESALRMQSQMGGGHLAAAQHGHLSSAGVGHAGGAAAFSSLFGGGSANSAAKLGSGLLDHLPPFDTPIADHSAFSASSTGRAGNRLPLWLSAAAAAAGGHHPLLSANPNPNNIPLQPPPLSNLQGSPAPATVFLSNPAMASSAPHASSGMLFGNPNPELLVGDAAANGSYGGLCSFNGLASISNAVYGAQSEPPSAPQISATSLLQKATQMGSVSAADNLSFFKGGFASAMAPVSSTDAMYWPSPSSVRSSHGLPRNHALAGRQLAIAPTSTGFLGDRTSPAIDPETRFRGSVLHNMDHASAVQEMVASFNSGGVSMGGLSSATSLFMRGGDHVHSVIPRSNAGTQLLGADLSHSIMPAPESPSPASMIQAQQALQQQQMGNLTPVLNRLSSKLVKTEDVSAAADNFTRDFLGVRGDNSIMESLDKSLFQRELGLTYCGNSYNHSKDLSSEGENMSVQSSYPKPWEGPQ